MTFKVGDKIRCVKDQNVWFDHEDNYNNILTVIGTDDGEDYVNEENNTIEVGAFFACATNTEDFVKVEDQYFAGVGVGLAGGNEHLSIEGAPFLVKASEVVLPFVQPATVPNMKFGAAPPELGVFRPNLEDRKVGKVRVELVDDGFPLALREIAKVMTWAQTAKGYKDHDWQNLPNPEQSLSGATSRHRVDHIIQRIVDEKPAIECTDHESELLHKAHEAFGVLAQLELILRGVIK